VNSRPADKRASAEVLVQFSDAEPTDCWKMERLTMQASVRELRYTRNATLSVQ